MRTPLLILQAVTFVMLGGLLCFDGSWKLGAAQLLLAAVQVLVYA